MENSANKKRKPLVKAASFFLLYRLFFNATITADEIKQSSVAVYHNACSGALTSSGLTTTKYVHNACTIKNMIIPLTRNVLITYALIVLIIKPPKFLFS